MASAGASGQDVARYFASVKDSEPDGQDFGEDTGFTLVGLYLEEPSLRIALTRFIGDSVEYTRAQTGVSETTSVQRFSPTRLAARTINLYLASKSTSANTVTPPFSAIINHLDAVIASCPGTLPGQDDTTGCPRELIGYYFYVTHSFLANGGFPGVVNFPILSEDTNTLWWAVKIMSGMYDLHTKLRLVLAGEYLKTFGSGDFLIMSALGNRLQTLLDVMESKTNRSSLDASCLDYYGNLTLDACEAATVALPGTTD